MAARRFRLAAALLVAPALAPSSARADTVKLKNGDVIEKVRARIVGDRVVVSRELGSTSYPMAEVAEIETDPTWRDEDELGRRKIQAGQDPVQLAGLAAWCAEHGFESEGRKLGDVSRGIALDHRMDEIAARKDPALRVAGYLALWDDMKDESYSEAERRAVLERALGVDPENVDVRRLLGQVKRNGQWVSEAEAQRIDAEAEEKAMVARGLVKYEGRWVTPAEVAAADASKEAAAREADEAALLAARRAQAERSDEDFIAAMPYYPPGGWYVDGSGWDDGYDYGYGYGYGYGGGFLVNGRWSRPRYGSTGLGGWRGLHGGGVRVGGGYHGGGGYLGGGSHGGGGHHGR